MSGRPFIDTAMTLATRPHALTHPTTPGFDARVLVEHLARTGMRLLEDGGAAWDGAALAALAERWRAAFQATGVVAGDRVVLALPPGASFVGARFCKTNRNRAPQPATGACDKRP